MLQYRSTVTTELANDYLFIYTKSTTYRNLIGMLQDKLKKVPHNYYCALLRDIKT